MSIRIALLSAALFVGSAGVAVAAETAGASPQFGSEAEFVAKFGAQAQKTGQGQYQLQRGATNYRINFGAAALRAALDEVEAQLRHLADDAKTSAKSAGDRARLLQRREELQQRLSAGGTKGYEYQQGSIAQCGFGVTLQATAVPQITGGLAMASASVTPAGTVPAGGWHAVIDMYATAGASNLAGGLVSRTDDHVSHVAYNNYSGPSRPAQAEIMAWYTCLRATTYVEVIAPSGNIWFPSYCGQPLAIIAQHADVGCPAFY